MRSWPVFAVILLFGAPARAEAAPALRIYEEEFHLRADRRFEIEGWREAEASAGELAAAGGCRALDVDCTDAASGPAAAERYLKRPIESDAYRGTARLMRVRGSAYYARFAAPPGYSVCRAGLYARSGLLRGDAVFAGALQRSGIDGLAVYANLGTAADSAAEFRLLVLYVPRDSLQASRCWPDQTIVFLCGAGTCSPSRAYPQTDLR